jgi:hypothetical protein
MAGTSMADSSLIPTSCPFDTTDSHCDGGRARERESAVLTKRDPLDVLTSSLSPLPITRERRDGPQSGVIRVLLSRSLLGLVTQDGAPGHGDKKSRVVAR